MRKATFAAAVSSLLAVGAVANDMAVATWWWAGEKAADPVVAAERLDFLSANGVTEIYIWPHRDTTDEQLAQFVLAAKEKGIRVAWLCGDVSWIAPGDLGFDDVFARYLRYQSSVPEDARFFAIHLDVEPHQNAKLEDGRRWQLYADFVARACAMAHAAGEKIEWDIPFWLDGKKVFRGVDPDASLLEMVMDLSDGVTLMSYRDTAEAMLDVSREEIALSRTRRCRVLLGAETGKTDEGDYVSYYEEGKAAMVAELAKVKEALAQAGIHAGTGVAVHHVGSWMSLKN